MDVCRFVKAGAIRFGATRKPVAKRPFPGTMKSKNFWLVPFAAIFPCRFHLAINIRIAMYRRRDGDAIGNGLVAGDDYFHQR